MQQLDQTAFSRNALRAFVPGRDFEASQWFYAELRALPGLGGDLW
jgi:hypothetical protein